MRGEDFVQHNRAMIGLGSNPNVAAALVISLESESAGRIAKGIADTGKPVDWLSIQEVGGTVKAMDRGMGIATKMLVQASRARREMVPLSELVLGVECGGADTTSGLASNAATGQVANWVVEADGTVILSETTEIIGGEHFLIDRAASPMAAEAHRRVVNWWEENARHLGFRLTNLALDNIEGGLTTMEEKSLGAIRKGGTSTLREVVGYAERPMKKGLVFMDTPAPATENITSIAAAGAQIIIFSTGVGNPIGSPVAPTIKVGGNPNTVVHFGDNIDVDVSWIVRGEKVVPVASEAIYEELINVANGKKTRSETLGDVETAISRKGAWLIA